MNLSTISYLQLIILLSVITVGIQGIKRRNLNIVPQSILIQTVQEIPSRPSRPSRPSGPSRSNLQSCSSRPTQIQIAKCVSTEYISTVRYTICKTCKTNYRLQSSRRSCLPRVHFCSEYSKINQNFCTKCINGYVLSQQDNFCYRTVNNCLMFNQIDDSCKKCINGYQFSNNACNPRSCLVGEYLSPSNLCVKGNITNCLEYFSPSGQCEICTSNYTLSQNKCLPQPKCPEDTKTNFWILRHGKCVPVTAGCIYILDDGCGACQSSHYLIGGICVPIFFQPASQTFSQFNP